MTLLNTGGFPVDLSSTINTALPNSPAASSVRATCSYLDSTNGYMYIGYQYNIGSSTATNIVIQVNLSNGAINTITIPNINDIVNGPFTPETRSIAVDEVNNHVFTIDRSNYVVFKFDGATLAQIGTEVNLRSVIIQGLMAISYQSGHLYVADYGRIHVITSGSPQMVYQRTLTPIPDPFQDNFLAYQMAIDTNYLYYTFEDASAFNYLQKININGPSLVSNFEFIPGSYATPQPPLGSSGGVPLYRAQMVRTNPTTATAFIAIWTDSVTLAGSLISINQNEGGGGSPPVVTSFFPNPVGRNQTTTATGTGFTGTTNVTISGISATFSITDDFTLVITIPNTAPIGSDPVIVTNPSGSSSPVNVNVIPTITSFFPNPVGRNQNTTATGTGFTGTTNVTVNGISASFGVTNDTTLVITIPNGAPFGSDPVIVTTPGGTSPSANVTIDPPAIISSFLPFAGTDGSTVFVSGSNFTGATDVQFHGTSAASFIVVNSSHIVAVVPNDFIPGFISVFGQYGTGISPQEFGKLSAGILTY